MGIPVTLSVIKQALFERQATLGLNDAQFAEELGITRAQWCYVRRGRQGVGLKVLAKVLNRFPDLEQKALAYLREVAEKNGNGDGG